MTRCPGALVSANAKYNFASGYSEYESSNVALIVRSYVTEGEYRNANLV